MELAYRDNGNLLPVDYELQLSDVSYENIYATKYLNYGMYLKVIWVW